MTKIQPYMKTAVAILGAVLTAVMTQFPDNEAVQQWGPIVSALLTALAVYAVPNRDPLAEHQDESVQPPSEQRILGKAFTGGTFSQADENARHDHDPHRP